MIDAILFDLDGTLIDTESVAMRAGRAALADLGHMVDDAFMHRLIGVDQPTSRRLIAQSLPDLNLDALAAGWDARFEAAISRDLPLKEGAAQLLATLSQPKPNRPMAIVTSSGQKAAHHKLHLGKIGHHFSHVITVNDVDNPKPAPDPYLLAAARLGVEPARCLVFEDSDIGAQAAHLAGCIVVQVPDIAPTQGVWAHHVATDLISGARHFGLM